MTQNRAPLKDYNPGEPLTARKLTSTNRRINDIQRAIAPPKQVKRSESAAGAGIGNEVFDSTSITEETVTATDSNGDTVDLERTTQIVLAETTTGRTITLNINWP